MRRPSKEILKEMQDLADKFHELNGEVQNLLGMGEDMKDVSTQKNQEIITGIIETVEVVMSEISDLELEYNKRAEELKGI